MRGQNPKIRILGTRPITSRVDDELQQNQVKCLKVHTVKPHLPHVLPQALNLCRRHREILHVVIFYSKGVSIHPYPFHYKRVDYLEFPLLS